MQYFVQYLVQILVQFLVQTAHVCTQKLNSYLTLYTYVTKQLIHVTQSA